MAEIDIEKREQALRNVVERTLPPFVKSCLEQAGTDKPLVMHQDAFAADYGKSEYELLGMAIKFAGLYGVGLRIIGRNSETLKGGGR